MLNFNNEYYIFNFLDKMTQEPNEQAKDKGEKEKKEKGIIDSIFDFFGINSESKEKKEFAQMILANKTTQTRQNKVYATALAENAQDAATNAFETMKTAKANCQNITLIANELNFNKEKMIELLKKIESAKNRHKAQSSEHMITNLAEEGTKCKLNGESILFRLQNCAEKSDNRAESAKSDLNFTQKALISDNAHEFRNFTKSSSLEAQEEFQNALSLSEMINSITKNAQEQLSKSNSELKNLGILAAYYS